MSDKTDQEFLKVLTQNVLASLVKRKSGTPMKLYQKPSRLYKSSTDGWVIEIGQLKPGKCYLQIWLDRFTRYDARKVWYGFFYDQSTPIEYLSKNAQKNLGQSMNLGDKNLESVGHDSLLNEKLQRTHFGLPFIETYDTSKSYFYGMYEFNTLDHRVLQRRQLTERIVEFFETVARSLLDVIPTNIEDNAYPRNENRQIVRQHIQRERNGYLATLRKQKDEFKCQVCGIRFEDVYGPIGRDFAEAHHIVPLSKIKGSTITSINDLITVCSNCHRMLHRLEGERGDVQRLKKMIKQQRLKKRAKQIV